MYDPSAKLKDMLDQEQRQFGGTIASCDTVNERSVGSAGMSADCAQTTEGRNDYRSCDQLRQLTSPVWDGNLMDKYSRDRLVKAGLVDRALGWNFLTPKGIEFCVTLGILRS